MEIDTGASVSIASRETFELIREGESHLELEEPTVRLQESRSKCADQPWSR